MHESRVRHDYAMPDAVARVVGTVRFTLDHTIPGLTHGKAVRSTSPHARIRRIDVSKAAAQPGVVRVITGKDLVEDDGIHPYFGELRKDQPPLAIDKVRYVGEPVAVVVAESKRSARQAAGLVEIEYEELDYVTNEVEAMRPDAPLVHEAWPQNMCGSWRLSRGELDRAWREADAIYEGTYTTPPASQVPMEPHVAIASWETHNRLHVWTSAQAPYAVRDTLGEMFSIPPELVRVEVFNVGGGFGAKSQVRIEPLVACAARLTGRPVRIELARDEVFLTVGRHAATVRARTGVKRDGTIVAREIEVVYNAGAYAITSPGASGQGLLRAPGPYRIPNIVATATARYTNTVPTGPFRGAMTPQVCFAYESQIDEIAADLGIDPVELRRRNLLTDGDTYATGEVMSDTHFIDLLDDVSRAIGWLEPAAAVTPGKARGKGLAVTLKNTKTPSRSEVKLKLHSDGQVQVRSSSVEMGQGANATMIQMTANELGIPNECIEIPFPDTQESPYDAATSSSRTTHTMGEALRDAAANLRRQLSEIAAGQWNCPPWDIEHGNGCIRSLGRPETTYGQVMKDAGLDELEVPGVFQSYGGLGKADPQNVQGGDLTAQWHEGAAGVEVEVDLDTGQVYVLRAHGACWAGRVVSPARVRKQNEGCVIFGIGQSLFEQLIYDHGAVANANLAHYMVPTMLDSPVELTSSALESDGADAAVHGVGEMAVPAVPPAVANAVFNATGVRIRDLPLTAERVLRALRAAKSGEGS